MKNQWLPDWKDETAYPDPETTSLQQWAWEFLRRNPEYQKDFLAWKEKGGDCLRGNTQYQYADELELTDDEKLRLGKSAAFFGKGGTSWVRSKKDSEGMKFTTAVDLLLKKYGLSDSHRSKDGSDEHLWGVLPDPSSSTLSPYPEGG